MTRPAPARAVLLGFLVLSLIGSLPGRAEVRQLTDSGRCNLSPEINRAGQVVWLERVIGTPRERLCLWTGSSLQQLTGDQASVGSFQINDAGEVGWETTGALGPQVYLWDGAAVRQISSGSVGSHPQLSASGQLFWVGGSRPDGMGPDVYLWDGAAVRRLTTRGQWIDSLQVNRVGQAVWRSWDGEDFEIYLWDGAAVRQLSENHFDDWEPQINNRGQVVWSGGSTDGSLFGREIYLWTGDVVRQITHNRLFDSQPQLNDAGQITWQGSDGSDGEIFLWDGDRIRQLTDNSQEDRNPRISQSGQVVWESLSSRDPNLFLWDGSVTRQLTHDDLRDGYAWDMNDDGKVVWQGLDGGDTEIYLWNGSIVVPLTNNRRSDNRPRINTAGQVVWYGLEHFLYGEIYEYTPDASGSLVIDPPRIPGSRSPTGTLFIGQPAPEGGAVVALTSDHPEVVTVPASVTIPAGAVNAPFPVTTAAVSEITPVEITASYGGATWTATLTLVPITLSSISLCFPSVTGGTRTGCFFLLSDGAPPGGAVLTITSSDLAIAWVPASYTVGPNSTGAAFRVLTAPVTAPTPVVITVSYGGVTRTATLTVLPSAVYSLWVTPETLAGGASATGVVTLTGPAPPGGAVVTLASDPADAATVPESLVVPPGATTAAFPIATRRVAGLTPVTVIATGGGASGGAVMRLWPTTLASISLATGSVKGGLSTSGRVTLSAPAPGGGTIVTLTSETPGPVSVPGAVLVPAGETSASFRVTTRPAGGTAMVIIAASLAQETRQAALMIVSISLAAVTVRPGAVTGGTPSTGTIVLSGPAPPGGAMVTLTSANPAAAAMPGSVIVPEGATKTTFPVTSSAVTQDQSMLLFAAYAGVTQTTRLTVRRKR